MSLPDELGIDKTTAHTPSIPLSISGEPIIWNKNYATIGGVLDQLFEAYERDGTFPLLFKYNAAFRGGKVYVESAETVTFITGKARVRRALDPRGGAGGAGAVDSVRQDLRRVARRVVRGAKLADT